MQRVGAPVRVDVAPWDVEDVGDGIDELVKAPGNQIHWHAPGMQQVDQITNLRSETRRMLLKKVFDLGLTRLDQIQSILQRFSECHIPAHRVRGHLADWRMREESNGN